MSDRVRALIWDYYDERSFGAPMILALALSDEADDRGGVFQSTAELAKKTRQSARAVQKQLRRLEGAGLLGCAERSAGGPGQFNRYQINLPLLVAPNPERGSGLTPNAVRSSEPANPERGSSFADPTLFTEVNTNVEGVAQRDGVEDQRLATWIFERIQALNPTHREPTWSAWRKDIRLMRTRDKRTRRDIAELFAWANAHAFWQANVLSPGALRRQWDRLALQRRQSSPTGAPSAPVDRRCTHVIHGGSRCTRDGVFGHPDGRRFCREHEEAAERERARG